MIEKYNYFRLAKQTDIEEITNLVRKYNRWFSHLNSDHFIKKIKKKECIYESGVLITFKTLKEKYKLGNYEVMPGNTILEQLIKNDEKSNSDFVKHVFIKFINCVAGSVYLAVNSRNQRAINFYNNMDLKRIGKTKLDYKDSNSIFVEGYIYKSEKFFLESSNY